MRLVDADKIRCEIALLEPNGDKIIKKYIDSQPTIDAVPGVRCNSCKHWLCKKDDGYCHSCDIDALLRPGNHFCSYGERKDDNND